MEPVSPQGRHLAASGFLESRDFSQALEGCGSRDPVEALESHARLKSLLADYLRNRMEEGDLKLVLQALDVFEDQVMMRKEGLR